MEYKMPIIAVAAFAAGYVVKSIMAPSGPAELSSALEEALAKDPVRYEQVIDQTMESAHQMKASANQHPTRESYVPFADLRLVLREQEEGDLTELVNNDTGETQPISYVNGRTAVGGYGGRLKSLTHETIDKGAQLVAGVKEDIETKGFWKYFKERTSGIRGTASSRLREAYGWIRDNIGSPKEQGK